jgi:hypothetical protein
MALTDPQSVTLNSVATSLPRVSVNDFSSRYQKDDGFVKLQISHQPNKTKTRRMVRLDTIDVAADPLLAGVNREVPFAVYLVIESPTVGLSLATQKDKVNGLLTALTASSGALLTKVLGGES